MTQSINLSGYSITSLDIATSNVLRAISSNDWESVPTHLIVLAYTTGDPEIFEPVENTIKTMQQEIEIIDSRQGITVSETYTNRTTDKLNTLQRSSLKLFKEIRMKMRSKGYLEINNFIKPRYENKPQMKVDQ